MINKIVIQERVMNENSDNPVLNEYCSLLQLNQYNLTFTLHRFIC